MISWKCWDFGSLAYDDFDKALQEFMCQEQRVPSLWLGEHPLVVTQGLRGKPTDIKKTGLMVYQSSRGGQSTLHLPGQLVFYPLFPLRNTIGLSSYVRLLEQVIMDVLASFSLESFTKEGQPGVYTRAGKIASVGLNVKKQWCTHGVSLNIACPLLPYTWIVPCGIDNMSVTSLAAHGYYPSLARCKQLMKEFFFKRFEEYSHVYQNSSTA